MPLRAFCLEICVCVRALETRSARMRGGGGDRTRDICMYGDESCSTAEYCADDGNALSLFPGAI